MMTSAEPSAESQALPSVVVQQAKSVSENLPAPKRHADYSRPLVYAYVSYSSSSALPFPLRILPVTQSLISFRHRQTPLFATTRKVTHSQNAARQGSQRVAGGSKNEADALEHLTNAATSRAVQTVASQPMGPEFELESSPASESLMAAAEGGDAAAVARLFATVRKREAEKSLQAAAVAAARQDAGGDLPTTTALKVAQTVNAALAASRYARCGAAPMPPLVPPELSGKEFHGLAVWRISSGTLQDYSDVAESLLRASWHDFSGTTCLRFSNPAREESVCLEGECAIGSATAGMTFASRHGVRIRVHRLWDKIVPSLGRASLEVSLARPG
ncbi:unnamed protein product [Parajaminaea phylloscopi]